MLIIRYIFFFSLGFCYFKQDPVMMSLAGSYNTLATGYNAIGVRIRSLPITPEKVLTALKEV